MVTPKKDIVLQYVIEKCNILIIEQSIKNNKIFGVTAQDIEENLNIVRNNASTLLNELEKEKKLCKLNGRPVRFIPIFLKDKTDKILKDKEKDDPFAQLIGSQSCILSQIEQAKAALTYPPKGLNTLLTGESGTGKTLFAKKMHQYLEKVKQEKVPFVAFNCADYYNNPELLMSQLFGYVKGAFTGAISDHFGLIQKANNGILFLDEVHRLPLAGQEMLFRILDTNKYNRLGDTDSSLESEILLIAATTENPDECLLKTFLRRIPVIVQLPNINERSIENRVALIEHIFNKEAEIVNKKIIVQNEVIQHLSLYECLGNIGQLESDIKLICAKAYMQNKTNEELYIGSEDLPKHIIVLSKELEEKKECLWYLKKLGNFISGESLTEEQADGVDLDIYYTKILSEFQKNKFELKEIYNLINNEIVDTSAYALSYASKKLNYQYNEDVIFAFSFHVKKMIDRFTQGKKIICGDVDEVMSKYKDEYEVAIQILDILSKYLRYDFFEEEIPFIAKILARSSQKSKELNRVGLLLIEHGQSTATSMAEVCNHLFQCEIVEAIDIPLEHSIYDYYEKIKSKIQNIDSGEGVIIMCDMGSPITVAKEMQKEINNNVRIVENISLPRALEMTRQVLFGNNSIEEIMDSLDFGVSQKKSLAILCVCTTGSGVAEIAEVLIKNILSDNEKEIEIIVCSITDVDNKTESYIRQLKNKQVVLCVGNINPDIGAPYIPITDLISDEGKKQFVKYIDESQNLFIPSKELINVYTKTEKILNQYLTYLNPHQAVIVVEKYINILKSVGVFFDEELISMFVMHTSCMIERNVLGQKILFPDCDIYTKEHIRLFEILKENISILEMKFQISINDDEICYMIKVLLQKNDIIKLKVKK